MRTLRTFFVAAVLTVFIAVPARCEISIQLQDLLSAVLYGYNGTNFNGDIYSSLKGTIGGKVVMELVDPSGKVILTREYTCPRSYSYGDAPICNITAPENVPNPGADVKDGKYTLRFLLADKLVYSLEISIVVNKDWNSVCIDGPWKNMALMDMNAIPTVTASFYMGGPDFMKELNPGMIQAQLFRDGKYVMKAHKETSFYYSCTSSPELLTFFTEDENHFTKWVSSEDILGVDGDYELKLYVNNEETKSYRFRVENGEFKPSIPQGTDKYMLPGKIHGTSGLAVWLYSE